MTIINIETNLGLTRIEIIKNNFTDKFVTFFKNSISKYPVMSRKVAVGLYQRYGPPSGFLESQTKRLQDCIAELNAMGTNFPFTVDEGTVQLRNAETQLLFNKLHRCFTTAHRSYYNGKAVWSDKFESNITIPPGSEDRFLHLIEIINSIVHQTEFYFYTDRKNAGGTAVMTNVEVMVDAYVNDGTRMIADAYVKIDKEDYQYFSDSDEFDVWVGKDILGKDYKIAYYEYDDASEWDIIHILGYTGKIAIDVSGTSRQELVKSEEFRSWISQYGVEYTPAMCGMPLGKIIEGKEYLESVTFQNPITFTKVTFDE